MFVCTELFTFSFTYFISSETGEGRELKSFETLKHVGPFRMGHDSFTYNNSVYFFGGYNGKLHDDFIVYHFGEYPG